MLQVGDMIDAMWIWTINKYPKLAVIDNDNFKHMVLQCRSEAEQDNILILFHEQKAQ